jgi:hypothetical protein
VFKAVPEGDSRRVATQGCRDGFADCASRLWVKFGLALVLEP